MIASKDRLEMVAVATEQAGSVEAAAEILGMKVATVERYERAWRNQYSCVAPATKKILIFDIETAPLEAYCWGIWKQNIDTSMIIHDWSILCWAAKWYDDERIYTGASWRDGGSIRDDRSCTLALAAMLDEADIVVAHNGDKFDIKRVNTRILKHRIHEPAPFKSVDTLKLVKNRFNITRNTLDYIGEFLGIGRKVSHSGFSMWRSVLEGDKEAQEEMLRYNVGDVTLLEQVYTALKPWHRQHPSVVVDFSEPRCTVCSSNSLTEIDSVRTSVSEFTAWRCDECGHYCRSGKNLKNSEEMSNTLRNIV